jgi:hypothetical protein
MVSMVSAVSVWWESKGRRITLAKTTLIPATQTASNMTAWSLSAGIKIDILHHSG